MLKMNIHEVAARNNEAGGYFFSRDTLRFFGDAASNWQAARIGDRVFIRNTRHKASRRVPAGCTLRGQVREVMPDGDISLAREEFHGLTFAQIEHVLAGNAARDAMTALQRDRATLDAIAATLSCREWSADTLDDVADLVRRTGREILDCDEYEED
jgi:hypothetical protein